jgi:hypothetical protein
MQILYSSFVVLWGFDLTLVASQTVTPESLNRLVASAADDSRIIGICGETRLKNEEDSWWTMIQVIFPLITIFHH